MDNLRLRRTPAVLAASALLAGAFVLSVPAASEAAGTVFTVYVSPHGSDADDGLSRQSPVATLAGAQAVLEDAHPTTDVAIRIEQGHYRAGSTSWDFYVPGHHVSFMPVDYRPGDTIGDIRGRPVFEGTGVPGGGAGFWLSMSLPPGDPGGVTGWRFYFLEVRDYEKGGLLFNGGAAADADNIVRPTTAGANGNTVHGMRFEDIGTTYASGPAAIGYDGLGTSNSSDNLFTGNEFVRLINDGERVVGNHMHGVYLTNGSDRNTITRNRFVTISGDPVKVKNDSNDNRIYRNTMIDAGVAGFYDDWFCDFTTGCADKQPQECASHGNLFYRNHEMSSRQVGHVPDAALLIPGQDYAGGPGCDNEGQQRVTAWGNINTSGSQESAPLHFNRPDAPTSGQVGRRYDAVLRAAGGTPPYTWALADGEDLDVPDGGFEEPTSPPAIQDWTVAYGEDPASFQIDHSRTHTGTGALLMRDARADAPAGLLSAPVPVHAGHTYDLSAWTYAERGNGAMYQYFYDAQGRQLSSTVTVIVTEPGRWQQTSAFVLAPPGAVTTRILLYSGRSAVTTEWWDEVVLRDSTLPAGIRLDSTAGVLVGTPTRPGDYDAVIAVRDSTGATVQKRLHLAISP